VALVPAALGGLAVVTWAVPSVWSAWSLKVAEGAASWSLLPVAMQLLYAPLPDQTRDGARRTVDGLLRKVGMGVAGLVLIAVARALGSSGVLTLIVLICAGLGVVLWRLRPRYVEAVQARVAGVQPEGVLELEGRLLLDALKSPTPERVLRAADLLTHAGLVTDEHVRLLLEHPHERVQERGVALADSLRVPAAWRQLEAMVATSERRPRDAAVWALARLNPDRASMVLPPAAVFGRHRAGCARRWEVCCRLMKTGSWRRAGCSSACSTGAWRRRSLNDGSSPGCWGRST
jgi:hypothetical protein